MAPDVLSRRGLNRALLGRQFLIHPAQLGQQARAEQVIATVEHLVGLQAQAPFPPYYGLWSRLAGFTPGDLAELLLTRQVVRIALMRGTIHLVSARDCLLLRPLVQPVLDRGMTLGYSKQLAGADLAEVAAAGRVLVEEAPRTFSELGLLLADRWPGYPPVALAHAIRTWVPLVQVPPRAVWGKAGRSAHTSAESWLGARLADRPSLDLLVTRYLAAFGPASVQDIQAWSGLTGLREVVERLRPSLRAFRTAEGGELFDLPDAPRPDEDMPVPVRLVAEFDNLLLSHADRSRVISEDDRKRSYTVNGIFPGTVLVDGFAAGIWKLSRARTAVTLTIEMFRQASPAVIDAVGSEARRMLDFAAGDAAVHGITFAPVH